MVRPQSLGEVAVPSSTAASSSATGLADADAGRRCGSPRRGGTLLDRALPAVAAFNAPENIGLSDADAAELTRMLRAVRDALSR